MTNEDGPWGARAPQPEPRRLKPLARRGLWLAFALAVAVLVVALARMFPEALRSRDDWLTLSYRLGLVVLVSAGLFRAGRGGLRQHLGHAAIWAGVIAVLALGYAYRAELAEAPQRLRMAFNIGGAPIVTAEHELTIPQDDSGAFIILGKVNGQRVRFMVDTGATDTVLSPDDARRLGVKLEGLHYGYEAETANGAGYGAPYVADSLEIGPIRADRFNMVINQAPMSSSLLGLSFLNRLESFEVRKRTLILRWRDGAAGAP